MTRTEGGLSFEPPASLVHILINIVDPDEAIISPK
jgi:hypothetical protein